MASSTHSGASQMASGHTLEHPLSGGTIEPPLTPLEPLLVGSFSSREELFFSINVWAYDRGYAFTTVYSYKIKGLTVVVYGCDRYASIKLV